MKRLIALWNCIPDYDPATEIILMVAGIVVALIVVLVRSIF